MNVGESNPQLRRIFFTIYVADGSALATTAAVAPPAHAVQVSINGAAFVDAGGSLQHIGAGSYYYEATAGEVATAGFLAVKYQATGFRTEIDWAPVGQLFTVGETNTTKLRLPFTIYDLTSEPPALATGATIAVASDMQLSVNGGAYANAVGTMPEVGSGLYYYQGVVGDAVTQGILVAKYANASFGTAITWITVDPAPTAAVTAPAFIAVTPPGDLSTDPSLARWVPVSMSFSVPAGYGVSIDVQIGDNSALWMSAYDEGIGGGQGEQALAPLFSDKSDVVIVGDVPSGRSFSIDLLPNGGWQRPDIKVVPYITLEVT